MGYNSFGSFHIFAPGAALVMLGGGKCWCIITDIIIVSGFFTVIGLHIMFDPHLNSMHYN